MARPLRIEFPGAVYHLTSRGDRREPIFADDEDRESFLDVLAQAMARFDAQVLAFCLMGNHYHLVVHTRQANLSRLMRHLNGVYTQAFNRRHGLVGHLFQGRFKAILVDRDAYLLEVCRYVELNPVRARMVPAPKDWPWSSYGAHCLRLPTPEWLDSDGLHGYVLCAPVHSLADRHKAARKYVALVESAPDLALWGTALRQQVYLGDEAFVARMQQELNTEQRHAKDIPMAQRQLLPRQSMADRIREVGGDRNAAMLAAYRQGGLTMSAIAAELGLSVSRVSRVIKALEGN